MPGRKFREKGDSYRKEVAYRNCDGLERLRDEVCDERKMEWKKVWRKDSTKKWMKEANDAPWHERPFQWMNEGMKEWKNEGMKEWSKKCTCKPAWQERRNKSTNMCGTLTMVTTPRCSTPRCSGVACFLHFVMWNRALATTPCTFSTFYNFQKCVERLSLYMIVWNAKHALAIQSCVFVSPTTFLDGGPHPRKQRPSSCCHGSHFTRKKHKVSCQERFSPVNAHACDSMTIDHDMMTWGWWWRWWWWWWRRWWWWWQHLTRLPCDSAVIRKFVT